MQLRYRVSADFTGSAVVIGNALGALLQTTSDYGRLVVNLPDDQNGTDHARGEAL
jgi:hypothetical protein